MVLKPSYIPSLKRDGDTNDAKFWLPFFPLTGSECTLPQKLFGKQAGKILSLQNAWHAIINLVPRWFPRNRRRFPSSKLPQWRGYATRPVGGHPRPWHHEKCPERESPNESKDYTSPIQTILPPVPPLKPAHFLDNTELAYGKLISTSNEIMDDTISVTGTAPVILTMELSQAALSW